MKSRLELIREGKRWTPQKSKKDQSSKYTPKNFTTNNDHCRENLDENDVLNSKPHKRKK